ncbi:MAG: YjbQ family protein [Melioribacteraceae bacterium]|nr:YjbQ family protein [Melioribacteraceae bacterium]
MDIKTLNFNIKTKGFSDIIDITNEINKCIGESFLQEGSALIFAPGATNGITTIEYEPGLLQDYPEFWEKLVPSSQTYKHDETWNDRNGFSHIRASLQGNSLTIPFIDGKMILGTWQQIVFIDFDNRGRNRKVIVQVTGK